MTQFDAGRPIYQQIAERIRNDMVSGRLESEAQIMSTNEYARAFRINPATVARAFNDLVEAGLIYKRRGLGMFVCPDAGQRLRAERRERFLAESVDPLVAEARLLGIPLEEVIERVRQADDAKGKKGEL